MSLINDLFPNIKLEKETYAELEAAMDKEAQAAGLICHPPWILKIIQVSFKKINCFLISIEMLTMILAFRNTTCTTWNDDSRPFRCR